MPVRRLHQKLLLLTLISMFIMVTVASHQLVKASMLDPVPIPREEQSETEFIYYLPFIATPVDLTKPLPPPIAHYSDTLPLDFKAIAADFKGRNKELAFNKIGFHVGPGGNREGLDDWMTSLDAAGVPFFLKSVDDYGPLLEAQALMEASGVPHILVYRLSNGQNDGYEYDLPNYNLDPETAAQVHWQKHLEKFPPGLDPQNVWLETVNEVDKNRSEWLGQFALETARLALRDGYRWAAFGWSSGEPEPEDWESPSMLAFLRLAAQNPDQLAIALHEYSLTVDDIGSIYPWRVGRFQHLFQACDENGIKRPTVLITEWGWEYQHVPEPSVAIVDIQWAAWLYSAFPEVRGAAIWYLGPGFGDIADEAQKLISPVTDYSLSNYFEIVPGQGKIEPSLLAP